MEPRAYLTTLASEGTALADAAEGRLDRPVLTCPGWTVADLVAHLGGVHSWVCRVVAAGGERVGPRETPTPPEDGTALLAWYRSGLADLIAALSVDPQTPAWTFSATAPDTVGWWRRRQALETAVHRWDVQAAGAGAAGAAGAADPIGPELAVEGVDELLVEFLPGILSARPVEELTGTLHLHATDTTGEWWLDLDAEGLTTRREHAKADTALRGPASGLYLWLSNRQTPEEAGLEVFGRAETVAAWPAVRF
jgi:uncharacterized protein (TIGR03083 family)